ncbi:hypothetical protein GCM10010300_10360 [Streptomyces olivaceoviridis]|nr:hypothetical protein GCM10010300_10360 [Streptomyces olivaceoviridis]
MRQADDSPGFTDALAGGRHAFVGVLRWIAPALGAALPFVALAALLVPLWPRVVRPRLPRGARARDDRARPAAVGPPRTGLRRGGRAGRRGLSPDGAREGGRDGRNRAP